MKKLFITAASLAALGFASHAAAIEVDSDKAARGQATYQAACFACHGTGAAGAPVLGNQEAWAPRLAQGMDVLIQHSIEGMPGTAMVAKGGRADLSDEAVIEATHYMVQGSM